MKYFVLMTLFLAGCSGKSACNLTGLVASAIQRPPDGYEYSVFVVENESSHLVRAVNIQPCGATRVGVNHLSPSTKLKPRQSITIYDIPPGCWDTIARSQTVIGDNAYQNDWRMTAATTYRWVLYDDTERTVFSRIDSSVSHVKLAGTPLVDLFTETSDRTSTTYHQRSYDRPPD